MQPLAKSTLETAEKLKDREKHDRELPDKAPPDVREQAPKQPEDQRDADRPGDVRQEAKKRLEDQRETQIRTNMRQIMAEKRSKKEQEKRIAKLPRAL